MKERLAEWGREVEQALETGALRALRDRMHAELDRQGGAEAMTSEQWNDCVNAMHDRLIKRTVQLAEVQLEQEGHGRPPCRYALLLFGSGGRREQTLWSDQDNGLIYADPEPGLEEAAGLYFERLGERVVAHLYELGYPPCEGLVMCNQAVWRRSASGWRELLDRWMEQRDWESLRYLLLVADVRAIYGEGELAAALRRPLLERAATDEALLHGLLRNTLRRKVSLGILGQLIPERFGEHMGGVDIKYGAYIPLVNGIRMLAILHGAEPSGTLERLAELEAKQLEERDRVHAWREAFGAIVQLRSLASEKLGDGYYSTSGILPAVRLNADRRSALKAALRTVRRLHRHTAKQVQAEGRRTP